MGNGDAYDDGKLPNEKLVYVESIYGKRNISKGVFLQKVRSAVLRPSSPSRGSSSGVVVGQPVDESDNVSSSASSAVNTSLSARIEQRTLENDAKFLH